MKNIPENLRILKATYVGKHSLTLDFSDGVRREIDFGPFLAASENPAIRMYLEDVSFRKFSLVDGELMWGDFDLIFPVIDLYNSDLAGNDDKTTCPDV